MSASSVALEVIEASLDEQLSDWEADVIWRDWIANEKTGVRIQTSARTVELSGVEISVPWRWRRRLRAAIDKWASCKAIEKFKGTNA